MGAARAGLKAGVFHAAAWPSDVHDALDAVGDVVKGIVFHVLETVWALVSAKEKLFHVYGGLHVLCDTLAPCKLSAFHPLSEDSGPIAPIDSGQRTIGQRTNRLFTCLLTVADSPELCFIHRWMTNFPIRIGYAADARKWLRQPVVWQELWRMTRLTKEQCKPFLQRHGAARRLTQVLPTNLYGFFQRLPIFSVEKTHRQQIAVVVAKKLNTNSSTGRRKMTLPAGFSRTGKTPLNLARAKRNAATVA